jgi:Tol biopolymer transport system component
MKLGKLLFCIVIVSLIVSMAIPMASAKKPENPGGGGGKQPPADPAIAYVDLKGNNKLMVMNADGSNKAAILSGEGGLPSWSPDGKHIAFLRGPWGAQSLWRIDVNVVGGKPEGSNLMELVADCNPHGEPAWSPAGDVIAYVTGSYFSPPSVLWTVPVGGGEPTQLLSVPHGIRFPTWNPDGSEVAFIDRWPPRGTPDPPPTVYSIKILTIATGEIRTVFETTDFSIEGRGLDWSRDGAKFAFRVYPPPFGASGDSIFTLEIATGQLEFIVEGGLYPTWSPDSTKIAYIGGGSLLTIELSTGEIEKLVGKNSWTPDWKR